LLLLANSGGVLTLSEKTLGEPTLHFTRSTPR
jgi:hypothetical protein